MLIYRFFYCIIYLSDNIKKVGIVMSNYNVNEKSKTISVSGVLTEVERNIISTYIMNGYKVKEKRKPDSSRIEDQDIINFFKNKKDEAGEKKYLEEKEKQITIAKKTKDGKPIKKKAGFLVALKWFRENYKEDYKKMLEDKKEENKKKKESKQK